MKRIEFITDNEEPITSYEKAKFEIIQLELDDIIRCSSAYEDDWGDDDGDDNYGDDDYSDDDPFGL